MAEKLPDPLPAHLAALSDKDLEGVIKRAEREGISLDKIKLRASDLTPEEELDAEEQDVTDALGIVKRTERENKPVNRLELREGDEPLRIASAMARLIKNQPFYAKSSSTRPFTSKFTDEDVRRAIEEDRENKRRGK
jgi:hypothetical protein